MVGITPVGFNQVNEIPAQDPQGNVVAEVAIAAINQGDQASPKPFIAAAINQGTNPKPPITITLAAAHRLALAEYRLSLDEAKEEVQKKMDKDKKDCLTELAFGFEHWKKGIEKLHNTLHQLIFPGEGRQTGTGLERNALSALQETNNMMVICKKRLRFETQQYRDLKDLQSKSLAYLIFARLLQSSHITNQNRYGS